MKISAKLDYSCRALIELSLNWPNTKPIQINLIARRQKIPLKFLTQIMVNLKQFGYVQSLRGKMGGYILVRAPADIRLSELISRFGGLDYAAADGNHIMYRIWQEVDKALIDHLQNVSFENICSRIREKNNHIVYDI
jgi:Rrf2 family protein